MNNAYFLTGTDTAIGKTFTTCALLRLAARQGLKAAGLKPVAAGINAAGRNDDVENIRAASNLLLPQEVVNTYCLKAEIAPHIAAAEEGVIIEFAPIKAACRTAMAAADLLIVEGVGGFCVPLSGDHNSADLAAALGLPIILVVGMRLGCLNHALLTAEAIASRGLTIAGWVANRIDPTMSHFADNLSTLQELLYAPLLGVIPHAPHGGSAGAAEFLTLPAAGDFCL